ncbi:phage lytic cycle repressor MrpR family protein [Paenibacillus xylaniclasticus]|uniref:phage lytic cycle repressor MrpR family protein n=1 Tax=Paenibacillus xylaniclasticus TaxID=588083 RepID=UPI000FDA2E9C|nr:MULTISPECIES: hypothetical protein [Paenibacillus]GFN34085.1 hypothetical protein PCURB6_43450 [Paenibacillus curdlanolyticus]
MTEMYNESIKQMYLNQFKVSTKEVYARLFRKSAVREKELGKDLYHFSDNEFELFLRDVLRPKTKESARTYCNVLTNYVQWAIDNPTESQARVLTNPLKRRQEYFYEFVQPAGKTYISYAEKEKIINKEMLINKQDSFIIQALWDGIQGGKLSELVNLKISDLDAVEKKVYIYDVDGEFVREIDVEDRTIQYAVEANKEKEYYKMNGTVDYRDNWKPILDLAPSEYVLKSVPTNSKDNNNGGKSVSHYTVHNRLEMIKSLTMFEEYKEAITTKNIVRSGMIYMAVKLYARDKEFDRKQIEEVCHKYDVKYKWSLRDFLNLDVLESLYPDDIQRIRREVALSN